MTRYFFISILLLVFFTSTANHVNAKSTKYTTVNTNNTKEEKEQTALPVQANAPKSSTRATMPEEAPEHKAHGPKLDEVPHIHHFHKERVKKSKRHHKKYWALSKIVLLLCHIALLMIAYMHTAQ